MLSLTEYRLTDEDKMLLSRLSACWVFSLSLSYEGLYERKGKVLISPTKW